MKYGGLICLLLWNTLLITVNSIKTPVILIPGMAGSPLEAKLDKPRVLDHSCTKKTDDYVLLWKDMKHLCPVTCFIDNLRLHYNATTRKTHNSEGVFTRVPPFAKANVLFAQKDVDQPADVPGNVYFDSIIKALEKHGYKKGVSLQAAPYDFRKGPHEIDEFWEDLKNMVVKTYEENGNKRVTMIVHSMGGPMALKFLHQQTQEFKDKYINALISLAGAYGGSFLSTSVFVKAGSAKHPLQVSQDSETEIETDTDYQKACSEVRKWGDLIWGMSSKHLHQMAATYPTLYWLFPSAVAWDNSSVLIQTPEKNYSLANIRELFQDLNQIEPYEMYKDVLPYNLNFSAPGVEIHCLYGYNVTTLSSLKYGKGLLKNPTEKLHGDGDGTVNINSLQACRQWKDQQKHAFHEKGFINLNHGAVTEDEAPIEYILKVLGAS